MNDMLCMTIVVISFIILVGFVVWTERKRGE